MGIKGLQMRSWRLSVKAGLVALFMGFMTPVSIAHDQHRPELNNWFMNLKSKAKVPCCSGSDATVVRDADWDTKDGHYRVRLEGQWVDVPDDAVIEEPNLDGQTLVWPIFYNPLGSPARIVIRCFMPGAGG
jgi:hypothetical protein